MSEEISNQDRFNVLQTHYETEGRSGQYHDKTKRVEINFIPTKDELLSTYVARIIQAIEQLEAKAWNQHVEGNKIWFCHKNVMGCFICQELQLLYILRNGFKDLAELTPLSVYKYVIQSHGKQHPRWTVTTI